jgi:hypothetical protein
MRERHRLASASARDHEQGSCPEATGLTPLAVFSGKPLRRVQRPQMVKFLLRHRMHETPP